MKTALQKQGTRTLLEPWELLLLSGSKKENESENGQGSIRIMFHFTGFYAHEMIKFPVVQGQIWQWPWGSTSQTCLLLNLFLCFLRSSMQVCPAPCTGAQRDLSFSVPLRGAKVKPHLD